MTEHAYAMSRTRWREKSERKAAKRRNTIQAAVDRRAWQAHRASRSHDASHCERTRGVTGRTSRTCSVVESANAARARRAVRHQLANSRASARHRKQVNRLSLDFGPDRRFTSMPTGRSNGKSPREFEPRGTKFSNTDTKFSTKFSNSDTRVPGTQAPQDSKFSQADHGSITRSDHVEKTVPRFVTDEEDGTDGCD